MIKVAVISRGVYRYLDRSIKQPLSVSTLTKPSAEILWDYDLLSLKEWTICDVWTLGLLMFNTKNPIGQGINIDSTAAQAWTLYINNYEKALNIARLNTKQNLQNITYTNNFDFDDYITSI